MARALQIADKFLPTPSHGGRHFSSVCSISFNIISTHALTWRATVWVYADHEPTSVFLPTPSHGGRPYYPTEQELTHGISTHALTWRAT